MKISDFFVLLFVFIGFQSCKKSVPGNNPSDPFKDGLIAYYPFDGDIQDHSGNGYDLTTSGPTLDKDRHGNSNSAYLFDGNSNYMKMPQLTKADSIRDFTISLWIKPIKVSYNTILSILAPSERCASEITLSYESPQYIIRDQLVFSYSNQNCTESVNSGYLSNPSSVWHHLVFVQSYDSSAFFNNYKYVQYLDGVRFASTAATSATMFSFSKGGMIGANNNSSDPTWNFDFFYGDIDEIRIYNRAMTADQVRQLYDTEN